MSIQKSVIWMKELKKFCDDVFRPVDKETADYIIAALEELDEYRQIGTLKECMIARKKHIPKKPKEYIAFDGIMREGCPTCDHNEILYAGQKYCSVCGQAIDWD